MDRNPGPHAGFCKHAVMRGGQEVPGFEDIPGYSVEGLIGAGPSGEVWLATEESTRDQVAIKQLQIDPVDGSDALRRLVATLDALAHPHLLRIRSIAGSDDRPALITDYAESGSLGQLLGARRHLDPGEAVTVLGPVAEALAAVHGRGLVHGSVTPDNVLFTQDGRPLLSDTAINQLTAGDEGLGGTHGFTDPQVSSTGQPSAAGDVFGLAAVGWAALTGSAPAATARPALLSLSPGIPPGLAHAIEAGLQEDPELRPAADQLADMVYAAASPAPVRFPVGSRPPRRRRRRRHCGRPLVRCADRDRCEWSELRSPPATADPSRAAGADGDPRPEADGGKDGGSKPRRLSPLLIGLTGGGALITVVAAVVLGLWWFGDEDKPVPPVGQPVVTTPPATTGPTPEATNESQNLPAQPAQRAGQWTAIVRGLVGLRSEAFERADPAIVDMIFIDDSPAARTDTDLITGLQQRGQHAEDYRLVVKAATVASRSPGQVRLHAITQQRAYTVVSTDGARQRTGTKPPLEADIVLRKADDGYWRIYNW